MEKTIRELIKDKYDTLTAKEQQVAKYVIDNYQQCMLLSSSELAEFSHVSHTAVIRFTKALGFSGFIEYKKNIIKEYVPTQKVYASLSTLESNRYASSSLVNWYFDNLKNDFSKLADNLPMNTIDKIVDIISNSDNVYLFGLGSDEIVAQFLKNYLTVMGIKCVTIVEDGLGMKERLFLISENDCLLMSVFPTIQESEVWVSNYAKSKHSRVILVTDSEITSKKILPDVSIELQESSETFFNSYVLQMMFCNALLLRLYEKNTEKISDAMKAYQDMLSQ